MKGERRTFQAEDSMCRGPASRGSREETVSTDHAAGRGGGRSALRSAQGAARVLAAPFDSTSGDGGIAGLWANLYSRRWPCGDWTLKCGAETLI